MPVSLDNLLVVGISSRALFDLEAEEVIFRTQGLEAYRKHQINNENEILKPGAGFALVRALLKLNELVDNQRLRCGPTSFHGCCSTFLGWLLLP